MKILLTLIAAAVLATGAWAGTSLLDDSDPARTVSLQGATTGATTTAATTAATTTGAEDISGPCDEAEHANDPRCTGGARSDDSSGRSGDDDRGDDDRGGNDNRGGDDDHEDRSGSNSGRG